jgi:putative membrane protein
VTTLVATTAAGRQAYRLLDLPLDEARRVADESVPGLLAEFSARF